MRVLRILRLCNGELICGAHLRTLFVPTCSQTEAFAHPCIMHHELNLILPGWSTAHDASAHRPDLRVRYRGDGCPRGGHRAYFILWSVKNAFKK
jgi:hypothetical protein